MTDAEKLRALASYFDDYELDENCPWKYVQDVQADLRRIADQLDTLSNMDVEDGL